MLIIVDGVRSLPSRRGEEERGVTATGSELPSGDVAGGLALGGVREESVKLYKYAIVHPQWTTESAAAALDIPADEIVRSTRELIDMSLLRHSLDPARTYDAVSPESAAAALLQDEERLLHERQAQLASVRAEMLALLPTYYDARQRRRRVEAVDVIEDKDLVRRHLSSEANQAEREVCIAHPGGGLPEENLDRSIALDIPVLQRGVVMRSLLQHSTRYHRPTARYVTEVAQFGALVRTVPIVPRRVLIFDRRTAFIPVEVDAAGAGGGAVLVREPAVVGHLLSGFELMWNNGRPYPIGEAGLGPVVLDEVERAILQEMAGGAKDELIARRMALSLRTCRRYIAGILSSLGAQSRFQAGVLAQRQGLLD
ncbi:LuxR C-terminal-related transcriptional regulator [Actinoplanes sp. NPDC051859]|uniref:helix-turn-helix transcriptional regulator n=1 Tax=Actinoplanes sp. NPDC051859 TaxID=3363909 RepID=UPI00379C32F3